MIAVAETKKKRSKSNISQRRSTSSRSSSRSSSRRSVSASHSFSFFLKAIASNPVGKVFLIILGILTIVGLDILMTLNNFDRFYVLLGVELILAILIGWVIFVLKDRIKDRN